MISATPLPISRSWPALRALAGLALLAAALLLIASDWLRREAAVARCERAGLVFDAEAGRCDDAAFPFPAALALAE